MRLLAIGRFRPGPERDLFARYTQRLRPALELIELAEARGSVGEIRRREGQALLAALPASAFMVALDVAGDALTSLSLSTALECWLGLGRPLCFVIGGAEGLDRPVIERADRALSLGPLTWPHMLARVLLAEQLYRAQTIATGHPYHRSGRPQADRPQKGASLRQTDV
ncbi:23S rRNA (pseudouridine(1915)-N(3))-methyltransferase RlmH [Lichenicoccus sp.]|uniref:23S rRNA (pseudouridine(1915)-N(3))-methyltransferase RlmH n=1 Tax=Lichenicoccus sp. TaxID=2781899 RepID=UPI003D140CD5